MQNHLMPGVDQKTAGHLTEAIGGTGYENTRHEEFSVDRFKYARCMTRILLHRVSDERT
ncbi:hypothetical protein [Paraburkholderia terricola]|uniref:hypothetical protein n=1 Tax=Paraburkholderia terricola TaxID=169427 RepID=UPI001D0CCFF4|nr:MULTISPECIES: hypothetical protein [Paraburkholderia]